MRKKSHGVLVSLQLTILFLSTLSENHSATNTIASLQTIKDGQIMVSQRGKFALGFFSPGNNSGDRYVGIWHQQVTIKIPIWVANRATPLRDSSGVLRINRDGNLVVRDGRGHTLWSTNASVARGSSTAATIMDSGNLVLIGGSQNSSEKQKVLWESFDHPTNVLLPYMRLATGPNTDDRLQLSSWRTDSDPSIGNFRLGIGTPLLPQVFIWNGSLPYWRSGPWNDGKHIFIGIPGMVSAYPFGYRFSRDGRGRVELTSISALTSMVALDPSGTGRQSMWNGEKGVWDLQWFAPNGECDVYGRCGAFGSCSTLGRPICTCLEGFQPKNFEEWRNGNWSGGCVRTAELQCLIGGFDGGRADGFVMVGNIKLPDSPDSLLSDDVKVCEERCLENCSCIAYAFDAGIGCMYWREDLKDIREFPFGGMELYVRLALPKPKKKRAIKIVIIAVVVTAVALISILMYICCRKSNKKEDNRENKEFQALFQQGMERVLQEKSSNGARIGDASKIPKGPELSMFSYNVVAASTNNFSDECKIGKGGFGVVYKGLLTDGQEIAVKRLSKSSGQGMEEFVNEVALISKLQHRNLVRLLGCCIEGEEKLLVYEYMSNKSLDAFLFDPTKKGLLDWRKRFQIIEGIARGLIYLHRDSRFKIIHRDLKASNILLDGDMNPKISDFGMARIFGENQLHGETKRVVGTYGYMSPEYAMSGHFSELSDVFSFGVLLLEIVSGKRNNSSCFGEESVSLLNYTWRLWNQQRTMELVDSELDGASSLEVLRCIHVGLLCVQDFPKHRPTMPSILSMLENTQEVLPIPKQPAFTEGSLSEKELPHTFTINDLTISRSMLQGR